MVLPFPPTNAADVLSSSLPNLSTADIRGGRRGVSIHCYLDPPSSSRLDFPISFARGRSLGRERPPRQNLVFSCHAVPPRLDFFHTAMARARASEHQRPRSKTAPIEEITHGINKFREVLAAITDISQEGFPYRDAAQSKAELQFRECLRHTFGEDRKSVV